MKLIKLTSSIAILTFACSTATISTAEILKCRQDDGTISYSDRSCENAAMVGQLNVEDITPAGVASLQTYEAQNVAEVSFEELAAGEEATPAVATPWAQLPLTRVRYSTDVETVSQARETLASLDQQRPSSQVVDLAVYR